MRLVKIIATCFGIGYIQKGAGTLAALFYCGLWWWLNLGQLHLLLQLASAAVIYVLGEWSANRVEKEWGHDSNRVVIDEVLGMAIALLQVPKLFYWMLIAFVAFRFFDITKPLGVRRMERFASGRGVMMDDLLAGVYAFIVTQVVILVAGNWTSILN